MTAGAHCTIEVRAVPGSSKEGLAGKLGQAFKVKVRAPAQDGRANEALCALLACHLMLPRKNVRLSRGETARQKWVQIDGLDLAEVERRLSSA